MAVRTSLMLPSLMPPSPPAGDRFVTFDGIAKACAKAAGAPEPELVHFNPKDFDFGKEKPFPLRDQHFFTSVDKVSSSACQDRIYPQPYSRPQS